MIPLRDNQVKESVPVVTWTLVFLNCVIYLWDRGGGLFGPSVAFADLSFRSREVVQAILGTGDRFAIVTLLTSMFLHGSLMHLLGNLVFLVVFGSGIEDAMGGVRYALYYLGWGFVAAAAQIWVLPGSMVPTLGASGAIGGIMGAYFLLFPANRLEIFLAFFTFEVAAWVLLGLWFLFQILVRQEGVANWAHAGGFLAGMLTVLAMGGRRTILRGREAEYEFT